MKSSLMFSLLVLFIFLYEAQGIRLQKLSIPASNHHQLISKSSSSNQDEDGTVMATKISSGINRKHLTKIKSSSFSTTGDKNYYEKDPRTIQKFTRELVEKEETLSTALVPSKHEKTEVFSERYPDVIDITGMDYSPAKRKPPIHN